MYRLSGKYDEDDEGPPPLHQAHAMQVVLFERFHPIASPQQDSSRKQTKRSAKTSSKNKQMAKIEFPEVVEHDDAQVRRTVKGTKKESSKGNGAATGSPKLIEGDEGPPSSELIKTSKSGTKRGSVTIDSAFPELIEDGSGPVSGELITSSSSHKGDFIKDATKVRKHVPKLMDSDQGPGAVRVPRVCPEIIEDDHGLRAESSQVRSSKNTAIDTSPHF